MSFGSPIFRTHSHGCNFSIKFYPYSIGSASGKFASILFTFFPVDFDKLLRWLFPKHIHVGIRDQFVPLNTWVQTLHPDERDSAFKKPTISSKEGVSFANVKNFITHSKHLNRTEGFLVEGTSCLKNGFLTRYDLKLDLPSFSLSLTHHQ